LTTPGEKRSIKFREKCAPIKQTKRLQANNSPVGRTNRKETRGIIEESTSVPRQKASCEPPIIKVVEAPIITSTKPKQLYTTTPTCQTPRLITQEALNVFTATETNQHSNHQAYFTSSAWTYQGESTT